MRISCFLLLCLALLCALSTEIARGELEDQESPPQQPEPLGEPPPPPALKQEAAALKPKKRKYFIPDPTRVDAGIFHVGFAAGGNFYTEPKVDQNQRPLGSYFKDFGFGGGLYFDYDYMDIPLALRGFAGYKYKLNSVHVFAIEGLLRRMFAFSETVMFGLGAGVSAAVWYRTITSQSTREEVIFLPSLIFGGGFDFNPFMVDIKWLINRFGEDSTITGFELYFGVRL